MMKKLIATLALVLAGSCVTFASSSSPEVFGFSSEDMFNGSYLGVDTRDISADRLGELHLKEESGVEVTLVDQDAPAGRAGIKEHDVILTINGNKVESVEQLRRMIREVAPGRTVTVGISRKGQPMTLKALLADRKHSFAMGPNNFHFEVPAVPAIPAIPAIPAVPEMDLDMPVSVVVVHSSARSGLMVENLTPQLGDFLGVKDGQGVLVRSVEKGSRAERAGFHAGDVIVKVNGEGIHDSGDFGHALRGRTKDAVSVNIIRDKKGQTLTLTLPERKQTGSIEETKSSSDEDAEIIDVQAMNIELAKIRPQVELAIERVKPELAKVQVEVRKQVQEIRKQVEEIKKEMRSNRGDI
ncbi:MAG TPA: PDZ domain-containing protein [Terriglobales bacterium]|jgi:C-terminal processing protease CtpA/Prc|nr:PDZ domain-containing protein [Terriglobales bacterium]